MKFIHLSDLHIGRSLLHFSLIQDQEYILNQILNIIKDKKPDAVIISGDVYDKPTPSAEAVSLLNRFLTNISETGCELFVIYGNHDSAEKLAFASDLMKSNVHFSKVFDGKLEKVKVKDTNIYMLPYIKPIHVKKAFKDVEGIDELIANDYTMAVKYVLDHNDIQENERNILIAHQFVSGAIYSGSEEISSVGGMDNVAPNIFSAFDYVALGHIHSFQKVRQNIYYSGSPLKYSISEANQKKCIAIVDTNESVNIETIPLKPLRELRIVEGMYNDILNMEESDDFVSIILLDNELQYCAFDYIQQKVFKNALELKYKAEIGSGSVSTKDIDRSSLQEKSMLDLLKDFYLEAMNCEMSEDMQVLAQEVCEKAEEEN